MRGHESNFLHKVRKEKRGEKKREDKEQLIKSMMKQLVSSRTHQTGRTLESVRYHLARSGSQEIITPESQQTETFLDLL